MAILKDRYPETLHPDQLKRVEDTGTILGEWTHPADVEIPEDFPKEISVGKV